MRIESLVCIIIMSYKPGFRNHVNHYFLLRQVTNTRSQEFEKNVVLIRPVSFYVLVILRVMSYPWYSNWSLRIIYIDLKM